MKRYTILYYSLLVMVLFMMADCINIREDRSDCPPLIDPAEEIKTISFEYVGDTNDPDIFAEKISQVDLLVYNLNTGTLVTSQELTGNTFLEERTAIVSLDPGSYRLVAWANMTENTTITDENTLSQARVHATDYPLGYTGNDPLYMGQMDVTLDEEGYAEGTIRFHSAHINMRVLIDNPAWNASNPNDYPIVTLTELMPMYDMSMVDAMDFDAICTPNLTYNNITNVIESDFNVFRFEDENDCVLWVKNEAGEILASTSITQFLIDNSLSVENGGIYDYLEDVTVSILIKFYPTKVTITLPTWELNPTTPTTKIAINIDGKSTRTAAVDLKGKSEENTVTNMMIFLTDGNGVIKHTAVVNPGNFTQTASELKTNGIKFPEAIIGVEYQIYVLANYNKLGNVPTVGQNIKTAIVSIPDVSAIATDNYYPMTTCEPPMFVTFTEDNGSTNPAVPYEISGSVDQVQTKPIDIARLASRIDYVVKNTGNIYDITDTDLRVINTAPGSSSNAVIPSLTVQLKDYKVLHVPNSCYFIERTIDSNDIPEFSLGDNAWETNLEANWAFGIPLTNDTQYQVDPNWTEKRKLESESESVREAAMIEITNNQWADTEVSPLPIEENFSNILAYCTENTHPSTFVQERGTSTTLQIGGEIIPDNTIPVGSTLYVYGKRIYTSYDLLIAYNYNLKTLLGLVEPCNLELEEAGVNRYRPNGNRYPVIYYIVLKHFDNNDNYLMGPMEFAVVRNHIYQLEIQGIPIFGHPIAGEPDCNFVLLQAPDESNNAQLTLTLHTLPWVEVYKQIEW